MHAKEIGNTITRTDSYKVPHYQQYPKDTQYIHAFFESRGGEFDEVTFFGLQFYLKRYFEGVVVTEEMITKARRRFTAHFNNDQLFNERGWRRIVDVHGGKLPIRIKAVPEGTSVPTRNVLMTIENTDPELPWITNYAETVLTEIWYPSTVATQSREIRKTIYDALVKTGDPALVDYKMHDFGFRGSTSVESAGIGGAAHLLSFLGTDTLVALDVAEDYYHEPCAGHSIPAAEHSTITSWGMQHEVEAYRNMLQTYPTGLVAVVSDSYDIYHACSEIWGNILKDEVLQRDGTLVIRPDSGYPPEVVVKVLEILGGTFGYSINAKGFKVLNPKVRVIQGDGINRGMLRYILEAMTQRGWSADNVTFGSGGALLQKMDRDTLSFAYKASARCADGYWHDIMKNPVTDPGKRSKAGRLALVKQNDHYRTVREEEAVQRGLQNELVTVFENGKLLVDDSFAQIRARAACK